MTEEQIERAKRISEEIAVSFGLPRFYVEKAREVDISRKVFEEDPTIRKGLAIMESNRGNYGHGLSHARKVAIDAGAIIIIDNSSVGQESKLSKRLLLLAHLAGLFHDVKRSSPNHAQAGAEEAELILKDFDITDQERRVITDAIRNHEAFQPFEDIDSPPARLLSDALYDADKFRWGPDNFTEMLWDIVIPLKVPLEKLLEHFMPGMKGIEKIGKTFRTRTGKEYGPDFIDRGIKIGTELYASLNRDEFLNG
jgi:hypothetical protein